MINGHKKTIIMSKITSDRSGYWLKYNKRPEELLNIDSESDACIYGYIKQNTVFLIP